MIFPVTNGRHLWVRAMIWQWLAVTVVALAWLFKGGAWSLAAALGGSAAIFGGWLFARVALGGGVNTAGRTLARLLIGIGLKWGVVLIVLIASLMLGLPALALLIGTVTAVLTQTLGMAMQSRQPDVHDGR